MNGHRQKDKINAGENVEKREHLCTVVGTINFYSHYGKRYEGSLKLKVELPCDPTILLLGIGPMETKTLT